VGYPGDESIPSEKMRNKFCSSSKISYAHGGAENATRIVDCRRESIAARTRIQVKNDRKKMEHKVKHFLQS
jgi:hypothetical protein